ncbi:ERGIC and golgi family 3 [Trypanosoma conorhini]|uniref:ERGIC and golgi family 3 n=1 Tax=Trypanosoma conorhini TaxID=83891 RepID=A0A422NYC7_9TRYP|nr:ERGIC and golgi family 3 [Trypanosoma conorhini]RNF10458.1 ERGIC and golgi family 3 [Trypanosoma conorhini]
MSVLRRRSLLVTEEPSQGPLLKKVAAVDLFPKPKEDYTRVQTYRGAVVSLVTVIVIALLVSWEVCSYMLGREAYKTELSVDTSVATEVDFNLDITFPKVPCHEISLDILDVTGTFKLNVTRNLLKTPVDSKGHLAFIGPRQGIGKHGISRYEAKDDPNSPEFCGSCFFGKDQAPIGKDQKLCCNSCEEVMKAHDQNNLPRPPKNEVEQCIYELSRLNPGCNYKGTLRLRKVGGRLYFAPKRVGGGFQIQDVMRFDSSHKINKLTIGDERVTRFSRRGVHYPLNGHEFDAQRRFSEIRYFLKVVPTTYPSWKNAVLNATYEYGVQWNHRFIPIGFGQLPSVSFGFEFQPIQVNNYFKRPSFSHFLVQLCGIVGGLFVVLGLIDSLVMWIGNYF